MTNNDNNSGFNPIEADRRIQRNMNENFRQTKIIEINALGDYIIQLIELDKSKENEIIASDEANHWVKGAESLIKGFYSDFIADFRSIYNLRNEEELTYTKFQELRSCFKKAINIEI